MREHAGAAMKGILYPWLGAAWLVLALLCAAAVPAGAQPAEDGEPQYVESLERHQRRIEGLIDERLSALVPSGNYVLRARVSGERVTVPAPRVSGTQLDLPGFRPADGSELPQEERVRVDQVAVRIVVQEDLPEADRQYIRTVVPLLADFRPERGDRLDLQVIAPGTAQGTEPGVAQEPVPPGEEAAAPQAQQPPAQPRPAQAAQPQAEPAPAEGPLGLTPLDWLLIGLMGLILLLLLVVLLRVFFLPSPEQQPPQPAYAAAPAPEAAARQRARESEQEEAALETERRQAAQERLVRNLRSSVVKALFARPELGTQLVEQWRNEPARLNTLIHALGPQLARRAVLPHLDAETYRGLEETVRGEDMPSAEKLAETLKQANLFLVTREITEPEQVQSDPFGFLRELSWGQIAWLIKEEPLRVKAIVLSRINPDDTARILESIPREQQLEIAVHIGNIQSLPLDMLQSVGENLAEKAREVPDERSVDIEGPRTLVDLMTRTDAQTSRYLLQAMRAKDRHLSEAVEKRFFLFDALPLVPDDALRQVVRTMPSQRVIEAISGAPQELQRRAIMAFPENARAGLVNTLRAARVAPETTEAARRDMVRRFQALADEGRIDLKQISDAWRAQGAQADSEAEAS